MDLGTVIDSRCLFSRMSGVLNMDVQIAQGNLEAIDWENHDGVNRSMINDFLRNQFYDQVLSVYCKEQTIVDIGFGTGLLSILALKHKAKTIIAFESDLDRFVLGQKIISDLKLESCIHLHNQQYQHDSLPGSNYKYITETVNGNLWQEGLWHSLPRSPGACFLPARYGVEVYAVIVPDSFAAGLGHHNTGGGSFCPGVDIDQQFIDIVTNISQSKISTTHPLLSPGIHEFDDEIETIWGWIPHMRCITKQQLPVAQYSVNAETCTISRNDKIDPVNFDDQWIELIVPIPTNSAPVIMIPRAYIAHGEKILYLDTGHWGPTRKPVIVNRCSGQLILQHNVYRGQINWVLR